MPAPPDLARHPALDAAARAVLALLEPLDPREALARLETLHAAAAPGPARRALLAARIALLRGAPALTLPVVRPEPEPEPEPAPEPPAPKPVVIPQLDLAAMMALFEEPEEEPAADARPSDDGWTRIRLTEDGPRGPSQFPKGAALSVTLEDAARLLTAGVAEEMETVPLETELPPPDVSQEAAVAGQDGEATSAAPPQAIAPAPRPKRGAHRKTSAGAETERTAVEETDPKARASRGARRSRSAAAKDPRPETAPANSAATGEEAPPAPGLDPPTQAAFMPSGNQPSAEVSAPGLQTLNAAALASLSASDEPDPAAVGAALAPTGARNPPQKPHLYTAALAAVGLPEGQPPAEAPAVRGRPQGFDPAAFAALASLGDPDPAEDADDVGPEPDANPALDRTAPPTTSA
ncbi:hypothetical protein V6Z72_14105 [Cereibacter sphaeroides]|uniref:hypothetical protein n=1 Tax=Cereibacter sphaeroides TaxID=1063 RepID=UPI003990A298